MTRQTQPLKILAVTYEFPPVGGGGGRAAHDSLQVLVNQGHHVDVVTMHVAGLPTYEKPALHMRVWRTYAARWNRSVCSSFSAALWLVSALFKGISLMRRTNYDVIHATFILPSGIVAWVLGALFKTPYVLTAHGSDVPGHNNALTIHFRLLLPLWRRVVQAAAVTTTISSYLAEKIHQASSVTSVVIPNGVGASSYPQTTYGRRILAVGRLQRFKGVDNVIRAFQRSRAVRHGYTLGIVGNGPERQRLQRLAAADGDTITFFGRVPHQRVQELYAESSILVSASAFESFGGVVMEAMAAGLAIITSDVGGCRELVGETGMLFPANDVAPLIAAINELTEDPELTRALGAQARTRVQNEYDIVSVAQSYEEVFRTAAQD